MYSLGFIGGGRATRIIPKGFAHTNTAIKEITVSDIDLTLLEQLKNEFPGICISHNDNALPAEKDIIFISLHPPVMVEQLKNIKQHLKKSSIVVSLAPKLTIAKIKDSLEGFDRIIRMNPNAPSLINKGFNPVCFSESFYPSEKNQLLKLFAQLGKCPEVNEHKLEAFAVVTAMGPTYFWFQLNELKQIAESFGLDSEDINCGLRTMMIGAVDTLLNSGLKPAEVMDLVPVKPLGEYEEKVKEIYRNSLTAIYNRIKP